MATPITTKFTGKERDAETGLDYFGARYYSNGQGRFITPDWAAKSTAVPYADFTDPQSLNLYSYVRNLPASKFDADGHLFGDPWKPPPPVPPPPPPPAPRVDETAKKAFLPSMDNKKVANKTVKQLANILTNESR